MTGTQSHPAHLSEPNVLIPGPVYLSNTHPQFCLPAVLLPTALLLGLCMAGFLGHRQCQRPSVHFIRGASFPPVPLPWGTCQSVPFLESIFTAAL